MASRNMRSRSSTPDTMPPLKSTLMQRSLRRELKSLLSAWNTCDSAPQVRGKNEALKHFSRELLYTQAGPEILWNLQTRASCKNRLSKSPEPQEHDKYECFNAFVGCICSPCSTEA